MADEQAAAKDGRMLLWRLLHHPHKLEFLEMIKKSLLEKQEFLVIFLNQGGV